MAKILIVDDEAGIREVLLEILEDEGHICFAEEDGAAAFELLKTEDIDLVLLDIWLPNMGGIDILKIIKEEYPAIEVIMISGHANIDMAVKAIKEGAFDFMQKPLSLERVIALVNNALKLEKLKKENQELKNTMFSMDQMVGESPAIIKVKKLIEQSAASDARILILGENGTGKELVARAIHYKSKRVKNPFIEVNCAAIPDNLIESELFGHEKGAFTGALSARKGKFEIADTGSIFLDEIADMSLSAQAKVLRVIQEMRFERLGSEQTLKCDVRIISATNKNIQGEIEKGRFREDLYFRLNVIPILLPALRERKDDIPLLVDYFMEIFKRGHEKETKCFSEAAMQSLMDYSWPGNIRELKNFVERVNIMTDDNQIGQELVDKYLGREIQDVPNSFLDDFQEMSLNEARDYFEKTWLEEKLKEHKGNISHTAQAIGIYPSNLHAKIKKYNIELEK